MDSGSDDSESDDSDYSMPDASDKESLKGSQSNPETQGNHEDSDRESSNPSEGRPESDPDREMQWDLWETPAKDLPGEVLIQFMNDAKELANGGLPGTSQSDQEVWKERHEELREEFQRRVDGDGGHNDSSSDDSSSSSSSNSKGNNNSSNQ